MSSATGAVAAELEAGATAFDAPGCPARFALISLDPLDDVSSR